MPAPLTGIGAIRPTDVIRTDPAAKSNGDFRSLFEGAVARVESFQKDAAQSVDRYLAGEGDEVHETALASQRAELALDLFVQARNKVVSAYQEIMRMQM
jgi:flagellar hook-basal body complex protein FliE